MNAICQPRRPTRHGRRTRPMLRSVAALLLLGLGSAAHAVQPPVDAAPAAMASSLEAAFSDQVIVKYRRPELATEQKLLSPTHPAATILRAHGLGVMAVHGNAQGAQVIKLSRSLHVDDLQKLAASFLSGDPNVIYAEPDRRMHIQAAPTDPMYTSQWDLFETTGGMHVPEAWDLSIGAGVVVAVVDTGFRPHAELVPQLLQGYDFIADAHTANDGDGRDADASDPGDSCGNGQSSWHGTHVSGTIAASTNNGVGIAGIAYAAKLLPVRVLGCGGGYTSDIADGITWAAGAPGTGVQAPPQPARVINLSLGGPGACSATMQNAINAARAAGAVVVVAAGNSNAATSGFSPANCLGVITVGASGRGGGKAPYSNYGPEVDVSAPGGNTSQGLANGILSTLNTGITGPGDDSYAYYQGTSMAAPHASATAALMLSRNPDLTPDEVEVLLRSTTRSFVIACGVCGTGIVHAGAAVKAVYLGATPPAAVAEGEPNDALTQAQAIASFPSKVYGTMATAADVDSYKVNMPVGSTLTGRLVSNMASDYNLALRNSAGTLLGVSTRGKGLTDTIVWKNTTGKVIDVFLRVSRVSGGVGDSAGKYWLEINR